MTQARTRALRWALSAVAVALVCVGFFVHGLHEWVRVLMFVAIVGVAAWGNGAQTQASVRDIARAPADSVAPANADLPVQQKLAE